MPGIVGFITRNTSAEDNEAKLSSMLGCTLHESFYSHGVHHAPEIGCHVGWVNHRDSYADCNPIINVTRDVVLIFAGEHFTHDGREREGGGRRNRTASELLALYERQGDSFLLDLNGWFAGLLIDLRKKTVLLFGDRFGMHRIYYAEGQDSFVFASEAKAVLAVAPDCRELDFSAVGQFLSFGSVFQERTLFKNLHLLPRGAAWTFDSGGRVQRTQYFTPDVWEQQPEQTTEEFYAELKDTISAILPEYYRADAAVSLTGGMDTRILMAGRPPLPRSTPCYTYGGFYRDCYDVSAASKIAAAAGQPHQVIPLGRDFFSDFADHAENTVWLTDGYMDISGSHELYYSRRARDIAPIRITGNYGSEVLRSHSTFGGAVPSGDVYSEEMIPYCKQALSTFAAIKRRHEVSFSAMEEVPFHLYGKLALAQSQLIVRSPYMDNRLVSLVYRGPAIRKTPEFSLRLVKDLNPALVGIQTDMGFSGTESKIVGRPRQAYRYATFKAEWYYNLGMTDWLAAFDRPVLKRFEPLFLGTHKIDHYRVWFRDYLLTYVRDMLSSSAIATRPYVRRQALEQLTRTDRITGRYVQDVSRLITLELIHKLFLSSTPSSRQAVVGSGSLAGAWKK